MEQRISSERNDSYLALSRLVLMHNSDFWNFHAAWFRFVDGGKESLSKPYHKHMLYELHYVLSGRLSIQFSRMKRLDVDAGDFVIIPPQMMHSIADESPPSFKLVSGFDIQTENPDVQRSINILHEGICCHESDTLKQLVKALRTKAEQVHMASSSLSPFLIQSIILEMLEIVCPQSSCPTYPDKEVTLKTSLNDERIEAAKLIIRDHIFSNITGSEVAGRLGISLRHLNRLCNTSCGCSINRLIMEERIRRGRFLLETTSMSLTDVSEAIGYSSVYAFIRAFTGITGISPGKYQKDAGRRG